MNISLRNIKTNYKKHVSIAINCFKLAKYFMIFVLILSPDLAFSQVNSEFLKATTILCKFPEGATDFTDEKGNYEGVKIAKDNTMSFAFDSINLSENKARMIGNKGGANVYVDLTSAGFNFIETTLTGNRMYTTIYPIRDSDGNYLATTSRHIYAGRGVLSSQWYGRCKVTD